MDVLDLWRMDAWTNNQRAARTNQLSAVVFRTQNADIVTMRVVEGRARGHGMPDADTSQDIEVVMASEATSSQWNHHRTMASAAEHG